MNFRPMVARESDPGVRCVFYVYVRVPHILNDVIYIGGAAVLHTSYQYICGMSLRLQIVCDLLEVIVETGFLKCG